MGKMLDPVAVKEFADTFFADPILKMAVNAVLKHAPGFDLVHCSECKKEWCAFRQYMKYELGIKDGFCSAGERKDE